MTKEEIAELKNDMILLSNTIIKSDRLIMLLKDDQLKTYYEKQLNYLLYNYRQMEDLLKTSIEDFIEYEKQSGNVINFSLRKLKKQMDK